MFGIGEDMAKRREWVAETRNLQLEFGSLGGIGCQNCIQAAW